MIFKISLTADEYGRMIKSEGRTFDEALFLYEWLQECQDDISTEKDGALPLWALNKHDVMDGLALIPRNDADQLSQVSSLLAVCVSLSVQVTSSQACTCTVIMMMAVISLC